MNMQRLKLSISPCPNDTFMFDAIVNGRIDPDGFSFDVEYHDIEELNRVGEESLAMARQIWLNGECA